jgi:general stress protein 26
MVNNRYDVSPDRLTQRAARPKAQSMATRTEAGMTDVNRILAAARQVMAKVTDCWAATPTAEGGVSARVVAPIPAMPDEEDWTICFVTSGRSRKAAEIARSGRLTLGYQHHPDRSYVVLSGQAALVAERSLICTRWHNAWRPYFPGGPEDPDVILVRLAVDRIELCMRGVSPEPFGILYAAIGRDKAGVWRSLSG